MSEQHPPEKGKKVYLTLNSVKPIVKVVAVYCPNLHGIHPNDQPYIRYLILVSADLTALFVDDPSVEDVARLWKRSHSRAEGGMVKSECPFCQALTAKDKESDGKST